MMCKEAAAACLLHAASQNSLPGSAAHIAYNLSVVNPYGLLLPTRSGGLSGNESGPIYLKNVIFTFENMRFWRWVDISRD
jgi:hypothetical protein